MEKHIYDPPLPQAQPSPSATGGAGVSDSKIRILRLPDVIARVGLKRASIYQYVSDGNFPKPVLLGSRAIGWIEHEIDAWLAERVQMRHQREKTHRKKR